MSINFRVEQSDGSARLGRLETSHGVVETPLFMPVGTGSIPAGQRTAVVANPAADLASHISVVLVGPTGKIDVKPGEAVSWIERAAGSFTIHLTGPVDLDTPFTYTIVNP